LPSAGRHGLSGCRPARAEPAPARLNYVFILIDDLGWANVGCYGSTFYETPNIASRTMFNARFVQSIFSVAGWPA
jgi:arylsulfatase A-like enzyme